MVSTPDRAPISSAARGLRLARWPVAVTIAVVALTLLVRYALDLLALVSVLILLNRWTRDALTDWAAGDRFEDEPDPVWAIGAVGVGVFGTLFAFLWLAGTTPWSGERRFTYFVPGAFTRMALWAERRGWGQRLALPGGPPERPMQTSADERPPAGPEQMARRTGSGTTAYSDSPVSSAGRSREGVSGTAGTAEAATPEREGSRADARMPASTSTTLESSPSTAPVGTRVRLTARVTARDGPPKGTVVFRLGSMILGSALVDAEGSASMTVSNLAVGTHDVTAEFTGSEAFRASRSLPLSQRVLP